MRYALVLMLALAGCATPEEEAARRAEVERQRAEQYREHVMAQCRGYGFTPGTQDFRQCLMQVDMAYRQQSEAQRQMLLQQYINQQGIFRR